MFVGQLMLVAEESDFVLTDKVRRRLLYLDLTLTCKAVCCAIFKKLHHHIFLSCELTQGGAPCDEAAH